MEEEDGVEGKDQSQPIVGVYCLRGGLKGSACIVFVSQPVEFEDVSYEAV